MKKSETDVDPMWTVYKDGGPYHTWGHLEEYAHRLENTGRAEGARLLLEKYQK